MEKSTTSCPGWLKNYRCLLNVHGTCHQQQICERSDQFFWKSKQKMGATSLSFIIFLILDTLSQLAILAYMFARRTYLSLCRGSNSINFPILCPNSTWPCVRLPLCNGRYVAPSGFTGILFIKILASLTCPARPKISTSHKAQWMVRCHKLYSCVQITTTPR